MSIVMVVPVGGARAYVLPSGTYHPDSSGLITIPESDKAEAVLQGCTPYSTAPALGAASSTAGDLPDFANTAGKQLEDSGIAIADVVLGPASAVTGNLAAFADETGKLLEDLGVSLSDIQLSSASIGTSSVAATLGYLPSGFNPANLMFSTVKLHNGSVVAVPVIPHD